MKKKNSKFKLIKNDGKFFVKTVGSIDKERNRKSMKKERKMPYQMGIGVG